MNESYQQHRVDMPPKSPDHLLPRSLGRYMPSAHPSLGLMLGGAAVVLVLVVGVLSFLAIERSEKAMSRLLGEKGASLIMAFESILRSGLRSNAGVRLQVLLEEMASSPDIIFAAVTMPDGTIIAHSKRHRLGDILSFDDHELDEAGIRQLAPGLASQWGIRHMEGQSIFLVYRYLTAGLNDLPSSIPNPVVFLGLDLSPFEITRSQNRNYVAMLSLVILLVGLLCLLAIYYSQQERESRQRGDKAESEVRRLEEEVQRKEKLAAIGTLAAGVAHEIRNPLSSIKGYATYFGQRFPEGSEDRKAAKVMVQEVDRLNRVITDLIGLSRPSDVKLRLICLENVAAHVLRLMGQDADQKGVELCFRTSRRVPKVMVDSERMRQVLLNLCINALDAMPEGGRLTLAVAGGKQRVSLMVRDTGTGIPPDAMPHIFDPYYTTKGHGTGLGLPIAHKIVEAHKGTLSVYSRLAGPDCPGETIFRIWLPVPPTSQAEGDQE
ncbi:MAG: two-component system sensor histidine kinase ZraS [Desulfovibrionaceae bacterium]|nr:two-component system sensor histidine kinase ZraS [Desulfovibrionaceae bacterium]